MIGASTRADLRLRLAHWTVALAAWLLPDGNPSPRRTFLWALKGWRRDQAETDRQRRLARAVIRLTQRNRPAGKRSGQAQGTGPRQ